MKKRGKFYTPKHITLLDCTYVFHIEFLKKLRKRRFIIFQETTPYDVFQIISNHNHSNVHEFCADETHEIIKHNDKTILQFDYFIRVIPVFPIIP